jgi:phage major head subunit gpT-like protein
MAITNRLSFPDWLTTAALPFLNEAVDYGQKLRPRWYEQVFDMRSTNRPHEQYTSFTKFGLMVETDEGAPVTYDSPIQGFDKTLTPLQYALGYQVSRLAFDDDRLGPVRNLAQGLGESDTESRNIITADIFNNGFNSSFTGADGVELFSTAHLREDGVTFRNELATSADFSITSLRTAQIDFANFRDGRGKRQMLVPAKILIPPDLEWDVREVLQSQLRPDTANNATNAFRVDSYNTAGMQIIVCHYLTDTDAWFLLADKSQLSPYPLVFLEREAFNTMNDVDFDTRTLKHAAWTRYDTDWTNNGSGMFGSSGA